MSKFRITGQLVALFSIVILIAVLLYTTLTIQSVNSNSEDLTITELTKLIDLTKNDWREGNAVSSSLQEHIYSINGEVNSNITSGDTYTYNFSDSDEIAKIIENRNGAERGLSEFMRSLNLHKGTSGQLSPSQNRYGLYIAYATSDPLMDSASDTYYYVIFFATEDTAQASFKNNMILGMCLSFVIAFSVSVIVLLAWSKRHVSRIKKLQAHILLLQETNYKDSYLDLGNDEIAELSEAIERMREQILKNDETKQEMLQNVSHDFKTPIAVIKSYAEAMQDGHMMDKGPDVIINQANILSNKTRQLITYNKLEYLTKDKEFEDVNMKRLIESVVSNTCVDTNLYINLNLKQGVYFKGYADNYQIVIENILDNAKRYAKTKIDITLGDDYIEIFNDGEPIDEKFINQGFKAYEKGSKGKFGLGMSIVVKTLNFFDYKLTVENKDNGVLFKIIKK